MINAFSVDLEDWFCVENLRGIIPHEDWDRCESRVERNTLSLLDLLSRQGVQATFFVLGWIAERYPDLVREVEHRGHEIATHGYSHMVLTAMTQGEFAADLDRSLEVLARCTGTPILGFRAPSFSVTKKTWWALEVLRSRGLRYDSSIFPVGFHPDYGVPDSKLEAYQIAEGLVEVPMSCAELLGRKVPCSGGGYFRLYPYSVTRYLIERCNLQGRPVIFYVHPWEVDPGQPHTKMPAMKRFRHYTNLDKTMGRLEQLLLDFRFAPIRSLAGIA